MSETETRAPAPARSLQIDRSGPGDRVGFNWYKTRYSRWTGEREYVTDMWGKPVKRFGIVFGGENTVGHRLGRWLRGLFASKGADSTIREMAAGAPEHVPNSTPLPEVPSRSK